MAKRLEILNTTMLRSGILGTLAVVLCTIPAVAQQVASTSEAEVCASDGRGGSAYSRAHRTYRLGRSGYEHDHVIPLCLGGADTEANLVWQPLDEAREKDRLERHACIQVCRHHAVSLAAAQAWFLGDWRIAYKRELGGEK